MRAWGSACRRTHRDREFCFREGFRRGYEDGYGRRYKYGRVSNGKIAILAGVRAGIVTYELIR